MAAIESCPKHNMIAYLEKTDGNAEFHEIIDFLTRSLIYYAFTVSPVVSTTFVEQLWMSAKSKTINNVGYITATVAGTQHPVTIQAKQIKDLKAQIKKLKKKARPVITHHKAWMKSVSMKTKIGRKEIYAKKVDAKGVYYMETKDAYNEKGVSTEDQVSTVKPDEDENATPTATLTVFGDNETIAEFLVSMSQNKAKQKRVEIKDAKDSDKPRPTSTRSLLTLKPLPKIDPKDKGKKVLKEEAESDAESEGVNEAERKFAKLANDEEIARKLQEEWETEEEKKKLAEEEATKAALIRDYDDIQDRIEADSILAARL
ncbi:hypothetical protein Tco_1096106 [Tanacetum coccineum]